MARKSQGTESHARAFILENSCYQPDENNKTQAASSDGHVPLWTRHRSHPALSSRTKTSSSSHLSPLSPFPFPSPFITLGEGRAPMRHRPPHPPLLRSREDDDEHRLLHLRRSSWFFVATLLLCNKKGRTRIGTSPSTPAAVAADAALQHHQWRLLCWGASDAAALQQHVRCKRRSCRCCVCARRDARGHLPNSGGRPR